MPQIQLFVVESRMTENDENRRKTAEGDEQPLRPSKTSSAEKSNLGEAMLPCTPCSPAPQHWGKQLRGWQDLGKGWFCHKFKATLSY